MPLTDDLEKLNALHERGVLTDDEFVLAKKRLLEGATEEVPRTSAKAAPSESTLKRFHRSATDHWIGGVCGGLGELSGIPSWSWRILFVLTTFLHGLGLLMYVLLWIFVPKQVVAPQPVSVARE